jgi:hypothetical protein
MKKGADLIQKKAAIIARLSNALAITQCGIKLTYSIKTDCVLMGLKSRSHWINTVGDDDLVMLHKVLLAVQKQLVPIEVASKPVVSLEHLELESDASCRSLLDFV